MVLHPETQLYRIVIRAFEEYRKSVSHIPAYERAIDEKCIGQRLSYNGRTLHLFGEVHSSKSPVIQVHKKVVPKIRQNPDDWLLLREGADSQVGNASDLPPHFYFQELARIFGLPYENAIAKLSAQRTKRYIMKNGKLTDLELDKSEAVWLLRQLGDEDALDLAIDDICCIFYVAEIMGISSERVDELVHEGSVRLVDFETVVLKHWNDYSRQIFEEKIKRYPTRHNILISAGEAHLPIWT